MTITESIKFDKLKEENKSLKNKLDEKEKEIVKLKEEQLYKEDFEIDNSCWGDCPANCLKHVRYILKDVSDYDKLPSKDVK